MKKLLSLLLVLSLMVVCCVPAMATPEDNTVIYNISSEPPQMCTIKATDTTSFQLFRHLLTGLMDLDTKDQPVPGVAADYPVVSEDGLTYTYTLRKDAVWQDGVAVTAKDFEYAWVQLLNPANACQYAEMAYCIKNAEGYFKYQSYALDPAGYEKAMNERNEKAKAADENAVLEVLPVEVKREDLGIKVIDDTTLEVALEYPVAYFNSLMAFGSFLPLRQDKFEEYGESYATDAEKFIGNGAYNLESWQHESEMVLVKSDTYFDKDNIKIDKLVAKMVNDANTAYSMFGTGEFDMIGLKGELIPLAEQDGYTALQYGDGATFYLQYNCNADQVTANLNIRKALGYGVNRQSFCDNILRDYSVPALTYTTKEIMGADGKTPFPEFIKPGYTDNDVELAKELWAKGCEELGMTSEEVAAKITLIADDSDLAKEVSAAYQSYWRDALGIEVVIENMPFKSRLQRTTDRQYSVVSGGWGPDYNDPMTFLAIFTTGNGNNTGDWSNAKYDELIDKANKEADVNARMQYLYEAEQTLIDDMPIAPVYFRQRNYVLSEGLEGVVRTAFQDYNFKGAHWAK